MRRDDSRCFLCGRSREAVRKLILGEIGGICLDCVALCVDIIQADASQAAAEAGQAPAEGVYDVGQRADVPGLP